MKCNGTITPEIAIVYNIKLVPGKYSYEVILHAIVDDKYSFTRARNALVELITSIESLGPPSYWYNISDNGIDILCELFRLEECVILSIMRTCGLIR